MKKSKPKLKKILRNLYYKVVRILKKNSKQIIHLIIKFLKNSYKDYFKLGAEIIIYGIVINYILYTLLDWSLNFKIIVALGFVFYFIKDELTEIIRSCKR